MHRNMERILRPIRRNSSPKQSDYTHYTDAKTELISRFSSGWVCKKHVASYCSYCERKIETNLAVEHIEPKNGNYGKPNLKGRWSNFLLACVNCNSTKGSKQVLLNKIYLPDRDNTFCAFKYLADGNIQPSSSLDTKAVETLDLLGLDKATREKYDSVGNLIAQDRAAQRLSAWGMAQDILEIYKKDPNNQVVQKLIVSNMVHCGFFSIWMTVFYNYSRMKLLFIKALSGTEESGCFDMTNGGVISPHPNQDQLASGGKI